MFARFERYWFSREREASPGLFRILLLGFLCLDYAERVLPRAKLYAARPAEFYEPVSVLRWLALPPPSQNLIFALSVVSPVLLVLGLVGFRTRATLFGFSLVNLYLQSFINSWGYTAHSAALPALILLLMPFMPRIAEFGVDAWWRKRQAHSVSDESQTGWAIRLCLVLVCSFYFASGVAKLRYSGVRWADGQTLAFYLSGGSPRGQSTQYFMSDPEAAKWRDGFGLVDYTYVADPTPLGRALATSPFLTRFLAGATLLLELSFPLALIGTKLRFIYLAAGALLHLGVMASMRIDFTSFLISYTLFVDWRGRVLRLRRQPRTVSTGHTE